MAVRFLQPVKPLLRRYFGQPAGTKSRSNLATSYHLTDAVIGTFPSLAIDYSKVILSRGELLGLQDAAATPMSTAILKLTWTDNSGQGQALPTDLIFAAAYNETRKQWEYRMAAATRGTPAFNFQLPAAWVGETVHCWIAVASADDYLYGNSEYFGPLSLV